MAIYNVNKDTGDITETAGRYGSSNSVFYGTIAQWNALTTEQKKTYDHASIPDSLDGNVTFPASKVMLPSGTSLANGVTMTKLWENPSPTAGFVAQNITLSSDDYDFLLVIANLSTGVDKNTSCIAKKGHGISLTRTDKSASLANIGRYINYNNNTSLAVADAFINNTTDNTKLIPIDIYGIKIG